MGGMRKSKEDYLTVSHLNRSQKASAKEAVIWLLRHSPCSGDDIAEHFGMQGELVALLVNELIRSGRVSRMPGQENILVFKDPLEKWWEKQLK